MVECARIAEDFVVYKGAPLIGPGFGANVQSQNCTGLPDLVSLCPKPLNSTVDPKSCMTQVPYTIGITVLQYSKRMQVS